MFAHVAAFFSFALAAVGSIFSPFQVEPAGAPSPANPAAYAEVASSTPETTAVAVPQGDTNVPVLVYHIVRPSYDSDSQAVRDIAVTPQIFDTELSWLTSAGYTVIGFDALEAHLTRGAALPAHPIILSFDDAWSNQYQYAFPILKAHGFTGTFFVFTNALDRKGFLTWNQLKEMQTAGMTIGDHSRSHPYLTKISSPSVLWDEIAGSKHELEARLGTPVREFAYPFGMHDATTTELVKEAGFASARGDYFTGAQNLEKLYVLSALNAPVTLDKFKRAFPAK